MRGEYYLDGKHEGGVASGVLLTHERPQLLVVIFEVVDYNVHDLAVALPGGLVEHILPLVVQLRYVRPSL